jgi:hypothetical protein
MVGLPASGFAPLTGNECVPLTSRRTGVGCESPLIRAGGECRGQIVARSGRAGCAEPQTGAVGARDTVAKPRRNRNGRGVEKPRTKVRARST